MRDITLNTVISAEKEIVTADMDGETVMMSIETGKYYNLGKMGSVIWGMLENPISMESLVLKLLEKYDVTRQQCKTEALSFLKDMNQEGLIEIR